MSAWKKHWSLRWDENLCTRLMILLIDAQLLCEERFCRLCVVIGIVPE
jgi:hypothetical protein